MLSTLDLLSCSIGGVGEVALAEALMRNVTLVRLQCYCGYSTSASDSLRSPWPYVIVPPV
jgi:hypothetical protein